MPVIRDVNNATLRLLGYERDELIGQPVSFINAAPDDSKVVDERRQNVLSGIGTVFEARHRCKDGTVRDFECSAAEMQVGSKTFAISVERDITERKRTEEERKKMFLWREGVNLLQQSLLAPSPLDRKLKNITDSIVKIFDADFCRIWLIRPGDRCEQGCVHAEVKEGPHVCRYRDRCLHLLASSGRYTHTDGKGHSRVPFGCYKIGLVASGEEHKFITNDVQNDPRVHNHEWARDQGLVSFAGYQVHVPGEQTLGVLALFAKNSITPAEDAMIDGLSSTLAILLKQDEAEKALRESEQRYRTLFDDANDGMALADVETGRIVECNQALCGIVERDKAELIGQMQSVLHQPQALANGQSAAFVQHKTGDPGMTLEENLLSKSGNLVPVEIRAAKVEINGHDYLLGIFRDISIRKNLAKEKEQLQAQLLQAQKLEAVGVLAGGVAHDFNNLLTAISGYISLAMMKIDESDPIHRDLKQAGIAAGRASNVVRQLLLFSRKQPAVELFSLNFNETINNLLKMLKRLIGEDVAINTELAPDLWTIRGDEGNIEQVIMNLVVNARDAMPQGGTITIRTQNVHIDEEYCKTHKDARPGAFACLSITDTGTGMDPGTMEHIFEPFFTTKEVGKGTGLGLSVVYGIVKQHEGWIVVESRPGGGTTFKMYLPSSYVKVERKAAEKVSIEKFKGKGERILVVEDQDEVRSLAIDVLKGNGYAVFPAENAKKARELFAQEKGGFDLVFSDVVLPDVSGIRLFEELSTGRNLRVLFSSGYSDDKAGLGVIKEKNYSFLQKPYSVQALLVAVREALDSKQGSAQ